MYQQKYLSARAKFLSLNSSAGVGGSREGGETHPTSVFKYYDGLVIVPEDSVKGYLLNTYHIVSFRPNYGKVPIPEHEITFDEFHKKAFEKLKKMDSGSDRFMSEEELKIFIEEFQRRLLLIPKLRVGTRIMFEFQDTIGSSGIKAKISTIKAITEDKIVLEYKTWTYGSNWEIDFPKVMDIIESEPITEIVVGEYYEIYNDKCFKYPDYRTVKVLRQIIYNGVQYQCNDLKSGMIYEVYANMFLRKVEVSDKK